MLFAILGNILGEENMTLVRIQNLALYATKSLKDLQELHYSLGAVFGEYEDVVRKHEMRDSECPTKSVVWLYIFSHNSIINGS